MHGGLPFPLKIPQGAGRISDDRELDDESLIDALRRYKAVNNKADFDIVKAEPFLRILRTLDLREKPRITLYEKAIKVRLAFKEQQFVIDYNFEEPDSVFILTRKEGKLFIKDCKLTEILQTVELF
jgi:hypothetical protein